MSHIHGQPHPEGTTEHLDYVRIDVNTTGELSQVAVVTRHTLVGISLIHEEVTVYRPNPSRGQRDLAKVLSATRLGTLSSILTALTSAATNADTATDPAPPQP